MTRQTDYQNAARREMEERGAADVATYKGARNIHNELADRHAEVALTEQQRRSDDTEPGPAFRGGSSGPRESDGNGLSTRPGN